MSRTTRNPKLLPCPFCGSKARRVARGCLGGDITLIQITCSARPTQCPVQPTTPTLPRDAAIKVWHARAPRSAPATQTETPN